MSKGIYQTKDKRLILSIESKDISILEDILYHSDNGEFMIEASDFEDTDILNLEPRLFRVLKEAVEEARPLVVTFRIY